MTIFPLILLREFWFCLLMQVTQRRPLRINFQPLHSKLKIYYSCDPTTTIFPKTSETSPVSLAFTASHFPLRSGCQQVLSPRFQCFRKRSDVQNIPITVLFFPYRGPNDQTKINLACTRRFRWIAGSTSNDSIRRLGLPGEKSGLKYPQPLQSLLSMNQVNILKDRFSVICKMIHSILIAFDSLHLLILVRDIGYRQGKNFTITSRNTSCWVVQLILMVAGKC